MTERHLIHIYRQVLCDYERPQKQTRYVLTIIRSHYAAAANERCFREQNVQKFQRGWLIRILI